MICSRGTKKQQSGKKDAGIIPQLWKCTTHCWTALAPRWTDENVCFQVVTICQATPPQLLRLIAFMVQLL